PLENYRKRNSRNRGNRSDEGEARELALQLRELSCALRIDIADLLPQFLALRSEALLEFRTQRRDRIADQRFDLRPERLAQRRQQVLEHHAFYLGLELRAMSQIGGMVADLAAQLIEQRQHRLMAMGARGLGSLAPRRLRGDFLGP